MRHLIMAAIMIVGALLITATTAAWLQNRAISTSNAGAYQPPPAPGSSSTASTPSAKPAGATTGTPRPDPAVIGVGGRSRLAPHTPVSLDHPV
jgi:hypothetical protein